jgi:hypothetical protein
MLALFFEGQAKAARERKRFVAWQAWHTGVLAQSTKIPPLADFMADDDQPKRKQTPEEQFSLALAWNAQLGGKVIYRDTD